MLKIVHKEAIGQAWWRLLLNAPQVASRLTPGQFLLIRCGDDRLTCYLRRPIYPIAHDEPLISLLVRPSADPGLAWLLSRQIGDTLDALGPLGRGFPAPNEANRVGLISDTPHLNPLLGQMELALRDGAAVTLAIGATRTADLYPVSHLPAAVELYAATLDGLAGQRGRLLDMLPELIAWADVIYATGSADLFLALQQQTEAVRFTVSTGFLYGLTQPPLLPCGVGLCDGCPQRTVNGVKLICTDGPVFDLAGWLSG